MKISEIASEIVTKGNGYYNSPTMSIAYRDRVPSDPELQGIVITSIRSDIKGQFNALMLEIEATGLPIFFDQVQSERLRFILEMQDYILIDEVNNTYQK